MFHHRKIARAPVLSVIQRLTEVRMAWQLSVSDVAQRIGCTSDHLRKCEIGHNDPSGKMLMKWADVLGFELSVWPKQKGK